MGKEREFVLIEVEDDESIMCRKRSAASDGNG